MLKMLSHFVLQGLFTLDSNELTNCCHTIYNVMVFFVCIMVNVPSVNLLWPAGVKFVVDDQSMVN